MLLCYCLPHIPGHLFQISNCNCATFTMATRLFLRLFRKRVPTSPTTRRTAYCLLIEHKINVPNNNNNNNNNGNENDSVREQTGTILNFN